MRQPNAVPVHYNGREAYRLEENYSYAWDGPDDCRRAITVPAGFICDLASTPRLSWTLVGILPDGLHRPAALIHDFIYQHGGRLPRGAFGMVKDGVWQDLYWSVWTREEADRLFGRIMREAGVDPDKRRLAYQAVRIFGASHWGRRDV